MEFKTSPRSGKSHPKQVGPVINSTQSKVSIASSPKTRRLPVAKTILPFVATIAILIAVVALYATDKPAIQTDQPTHSVAYQTVTPHDKTIEQLGGWRRVSPPGKAPVFAYMDSLDGVRISVSQQPLPDKFMEGTDTQLAELAKNFGATTEIRADQTKVYVGISAKGPQSAIFIKNGLLILVKSQGKISDEAWKNYAESLQ